MTSSTLHIEAKRKKIGQRSNYLERKSENYKIIKQIPQRTLERCSADNTEKGKKKIIKTKKGRKGNPQKGHCEKCSFFFSVC